MGRIFTIDLEGLNPEIETLSYLVKVSNSTSLASMTYPLKIFIEREEEEYVKDQE